MRYVPAEDRSRRGWQELARTPGGICRFCRRPIIVPDRTGVTKADALPCRRPRFVPAPRTREERGALYRSAIKRRDRVRARLPHGLRLYARAWWHRECDARWALMCGGERARGTLIRRDRICAACGLDLAAVERGLHRRYRWRGPLFVASPTEWPWISREALLAALEASGFDTWRHPAEVDHVVPLWAGGSNDSENIQLLCQPCHRRKTRHEASRRAELRSALITEGAA